MRVVLVLALLVLVEPFFLRREGAEAEAEADSDPSAASSSSNENAFDSIFSFSSLQSPFFLKPVNSQSPLAKYVDRFRNIYGKIIIKWVWVLPRVLRDLDPLHFPLKWRLSISRAGSFSKISMVKNVTAHNLTQYQF